MLQRAPLPPRAAFPNTFIKARCNETVCREQRNIDSASFYLLLNKDIIEQELCRKLSEH